MTTSPRVTRCFAGAMALALVSLLAGCRQAASPATTPSAAAAATPAPAQASAPEHEAYAPGLGEIMTLQQMRHTKLWFAGQAGNWTLAAYEIEELQEGFDDVVTYHPTHKDAPVAPKDAVPRMVTEPLKALAAVVEKGDAAAFPAAFDALTAKCNACHDAMDFGFNKVQRPATNPYPNQIFTPVRP